MPDPDRNSPAPARPDTIEAIRFFETQSTAKTIPDMSDTRAPARSEPVLDMGPSPGPMIAEPARAPGEATIVRMRDPDPEPPAAHDALAPASRGAAGAIDQLARLEDKAARIEEKLSRSEAHTQRVVDRFELASARMGDVALQSDLAAVRGEVSDIARRVRRLPGFTGLVAAAIITAVVTSTLTVAALRFLPGLLGR